VQTVPLCVLLINTTGHNTVIPSVAQSGILIFNSIMSPIALLTHGKLRKLLCLVCPPLSLHLKAKLILV